MQEISQNMYRSLNLTFFIRQSRVSRNSESIIYARLITNGQRVELSTGRRNKLKNKEISKVQILVKGKTRTFHSMGKPVYDKPQTLKCSTIMFHTFIMQDNKFEFTKLR